jgi:hypothetical protein
VYFVFLCIAALLAQDSVWKLSRHYLEREGVIMILRKL